MYISDAEFYASGASIAHGAGVSVLFFPPLFCILLSLSMNSLPPLIFSMNPNSIIAAFVTDWLAAFSNFDVHNPAAATGLTVNSKHKSSYRCRTRNAMCSIFPVKTIT